MLGFMLIAIGLIFLIYFIIYKDKSKVYNKNGEYKLMILPLLALVIGIWINLAVMIDGGTPNIIHRITSLIYIVFWLVFTWKSRSNKVLLTHSIVISAITFLTTIIGGLNVVFEFRISVGYILIAIFLTPLYGLSVGSWLLNYVVIGAVTFIWLGFGIILAKRTKRADIIKDN